MFFWPSVFRGPEVPRLGRPAHSGEGHLFIGLEVLPISLRGSPWSLSGPPWRPFWSPSGRKIASKGRPESFHGELRKEIGQTSKQHGHPPGASDWGDLTGRFRPLGIWIRRLYDLAAQLDHLGHLAFAA